MCLDGLCGRRATHEITALNCNDVTRFGGFRVPKGRIPSNIDERNVSAALSLVDDPADQVSALHMAVYLNDVSAIEKLYHVGPDVNTIMKVTHSLTH